MSDTSEKAKRGTSARPCANIPGPTFDASSAPATTRRPGASSELGTTSDGSALTRSPSTSTPVRALPTNSLPRPRRRSLAMSSSSETLAVAAT